MRTVLPQICTEVPGDKIGLSLAPTVLAIQRWPLVLRCLKFPLPHSSMVNVT